jgi:hypothetical protein
MVDTGESNEKAGIKRHARDTRGFHPKSIYSSSPPEESSLLLASLARPRELLLSIDPVLLD